MNRSLRYCFGFVVVYVFLVVCTSVAQVAATANEEYRTPALRAKAASEMDPPPCGYVQRSDVLVDSLGLHAGDTVADVGTLTRSQAVVRFVYERSLEIQALAKEKLPPPNVPL
jgi:hypothetical protein